MVKSLLLLCGIITAVWYHNCCVVCIITTVWDHNETKVTVEMTIVLLQ